ncbi:MAG: polysaccharide deacetylase family protein [Bacillota bacterium]
MRWPIRKSIALFSALLAGLILLVGGETIDWWRGVAIPYSPKAVAQSPAGDPLVAETQGVPSLTLAAWAAARSGARLDLGLIIPEGKADDPPAVDVYAHFLDDEGYPYQTITARQVVSMGPTRLAHEFAAMLLPEGGLSTATPAEARGLDGYVRKGGHLMSVWAAGLDQPPVASATGAATGTLFDLFGVTPQDGEVTRTQWVIPSWSPVAAHVDEGSMDGLVFRPYGAKAVESPRLPVLRGRARALTPDVYEADHAGGGRTVFVDGRLADEKRIGNDSLFRGIVRYFLDDVARLPRVTRSPGGAAGLVINLHVCSSAYFESLDRLLRMGAFDPRRPVSTHFTPGPDTYAPGDGLGVYATSQSKGRPFVKKMAAYGAVGAHGGWIHNYWAYESGRLPWATKQRYINDSLDTLAELTGRPVTEYSAPGGTHDLVTDDYLVQRGLVAAAYPGAENAPPSHSWTEGRRLSRLWHFGYTGDQRGFCPENMLTAGRTAADLVPEVRAIVDRVAESREIRLFYLHPLVVGEHPEVWRALAGAIDRQVQAGRLVVATMSDFVAYLDRVSRVRLEVRRAGGKLTLMAESPEEMTGVTLALPAPGGRARVRASAAHRLTFDPEGGWVYLTIDEPVTSLVATVETTTETSP